MIAKFTLRLPLGLRGNSFGKSQFQRTHAFSNRHTDFRITKAKIVAIFQVLTNWSQQEIAYISAAVHFELFKPINVCKVSDPITPGVKNRRTKIWAKKNLKFIFRITHSYDGKLKCMIKNLPSGYHLASGAILLAEMQFQRAHAFSNRHTDFRITKAKIMAIFQVLTNWSQQEIAYISAAVHFELFKPINVCKVSDPITPGVKNRRTKIWAKKNLKFIFRITHSYDGKLKCMIKNLRSGYHLASGAILLAEMQFQRAHAFSNRHTDFRITKAKIMAIFQVLTNWSQQEIAYISAAVHFELFKPINVCKVSDPITPGVKNRT